MDALDDKIWSKHEINDIYPYYTSNPASKLFANYIDTWLLTNYRLVNWTESFFETHHMATIKVSSIINGIILHSNCIGMLKKILWMIGMNSCFEHIYPKKRRWSCLLNERYSNIYWMNRGIFLIHWNLGVYIIYKQLIILLIWKVPFFMFIIIGIWTRKH